MGKFPESQDHDLGEKSILHAASTFAIGTRTNLYDDSLMQQKIC